MLVATVVAAVLTISITAVLAAADGALLATHASPVARPIVTDAERIHRALSLARLLGHLAFGTLVALAVSAAFQGMSPTGITAIALGLVILHVSAVEGAARFAGIARGRVVIERFAPFVRIVDVILRPITSLGGVAERALGRALPPADNALADHEMTAEHFHEVVAAEADVSAAEEELLHGVFSLGDTNVLEIMVPRVDIVGIEKTTPWSEVVDRIRSSEHSRFPVFDDTLDNVIGILYAKDMLPAIVADTEGPDDWTPLIRPASFIPATKTIDQQLRDFKAQRTHIAMVIDEYGGTAGLVTIENVLEEIVGEIRDEYDVEEPAIEQEGREHYWVSGRLTLFDLSELLGHDFQREDITTVGGLVYDAFGRVPRAGEVRTIAGFRIVVERVRRRRVERVYFERIRPAVEADE